MRLFALSALLLAFAGTTRADDTPAPRIRDLDPKTEARLAEAARQKGNVEFYAAANYVSDLGNDVPDHTGYGIALGGYAMPDPTPGSAWRSKYGASFTLFKTDAHEIRGGIPTDEFITGSMLIGEMGRFYTAGEKWEIGATVGAGVGLFYGEMDSPGQTHRKGNWDWVLQVKPQVSYKYSPAVHFFAAYRVAYMAPFYDTELLGRPTTKITYNAFEIGVTRRF